MATTILKKTPEELNQLVLDIFQNKVFTAWHLENLDDIRMVFSILHFLSEEDLQSLIEQEADLVYEYLDKAGEMSVNGYPSFLSCNFLSKEDTEYVRNKLIELTNVTDTVLNNGK